MTEFARWRREMRLTQAQAARLLGVSESQIRNWERGADRLRGRVSIPPEAVRVRMRALADGIVIEPWPE